MTAILAAVLLGAAACGGSAQGSGGSGGKVYKIAYSVPLGATDPQTIAANAFAKEVDTLTHGQVKVQVYPNLQLGTQDQIDQGVKSGTTQIVATAPGNMSTIYPQVKVITLPFLFSDRQHLFTSLDGTLGSQLSDDMAKAVGIRILAYGDLGWIQLLNRQHPITQLSDLKGMKIRTAGDPVQATTLSEVGAVPVSIDFGELYTALQTGTVSGLDLPVSVIVQGKYYEVAKYFTNVNLYYQNSVVFINNAFFQSLPQDLQKDVTKAAQDAANAERKTQVSQLDTEMKLLVSNGVKVATLSPAARAQWVSVNQQQVIAPFEKQYGSALVQAAQDNG